MSDFVDYSFAWPTIPASAPNTRDELCEAAVPWDCAFGWVPLLGAPWALSERCRVAYDLEKACKAGAFNPNLVIGSGAKKAPDLAAQKGVNYNDPNVLQAIAEEQRKNDAIGWQEMIDANRRLMSGDGSDPTYKPPELNTMLVIALVVVIGGLLLAQR